MNLVHRAALDLQEFVMAAGWRFCFIGGVVVARWGVERVTQDADMTVFTKVVQDDECITALLGRFAARNPEAAEFAARARSFAASRKWRWPRRGVGCFGL